MFNGYVEKPKITDFQVILSDIKLTDSFVHQNYAAKCIPRWRVITGCFAATHGETVAELAVVVAFFISYA